MVPSDYRFACLQRHDKLPPLWCDLVEISQHQDNHFEEEDATIFEVDFHIEVPRGEVMMDDGAFLRTLGRNELGIFPTFERKYIVQFSMDLLALRKWMFLVW